MKFIGNLILVLFLVALGGVIGYHSNRKAPVSHDIVVHDTLYRDSIITQIKPVPVHHYHTDTVKVVIEKEGRVDTVYLERETKVYVGDKYRAVVSGIQPSLDTIDVFQQDRIIYRTEKEYIPQRFKWNLSMTAGFATIFARENQILLPSLGAELLISPKRNRWVFSLEGGYMGAIGSGAVLSGPYGKVGVRYSLVNR